MTSVLVVVVFPTPPLPIRKAEIENIFRMGITNWKTEGRFSYQSVEQDFLVIFPRRDVEKDVFSVNTRSDN